MLSPTSARESKGTSEIAPSTTPMLSTAMGLQGLGRRLVSINASTSPIIHLHECFTIVDGRSTNINYQSNPVGGRFQ